MKRFAEAVGSVVGVVSGGVIGAVKGASIGIAVGGQSVQSREQFHVQLRGRLQQDWLETRLAQKLTERIAKKERRL